MPKTVLADNFVASLSQIGVIEQDYIGHHAELQRLEVQINLLRADNFILNRLVLLQRKSHYWS